MTFQELTARAREIVDSFGLQTASVNVELSHWTRQGNYKPTELNVRIFVSGLQCPSRYFAVDADEPETVLAMLEAECRKSLALPSPVSLDSLGDVPEKEMVVAGFARRRAGERDGALMHVHTASSSSRIKLFLWRTRR